MGRERMRSIRVAGRTELGRLQIQEVHRSYFVSSIGHSMIG